MALSRFYDTEEFDSSLLSLIYCFVSISWALEVFYVKFSLIECETKISQQWINDEKMNFNCVKMISFHFKLNAKQGENLKYKK